MTTHLASGATPAPAPALPAVPPPFVLRLSERLARFLRRLALALAPPQFGLLHLASARWVSDALGALARLGVPDALAGGPRTAGDLARGLDLDGPALHRLLRALAREGLLSESDDGRFGLTPLTEPLRADHPSSMRSMVLNLTAEPSARVWASLHTSVRKGGAVFEDLYGMDMWSWMEDHPDEGRVFHGAMAELTRDVAPAVARAHAFDRYSSIVDLAGGTGTLLATILRAHPSLEGVLVDRASVVDGARAVFERWGVLDRARVEAGDVFEAIPRDRDAYLAKHLLHGYDDDHCVAVLARWRAAMRPDARLLLIELVVPGPGEPFMAMLDLQMLISSFGGRERTAEEWRALLAAGGFELVAVHPTASPFALIEARPAPEGASRGGA